MRRRKKDRNRIVVIKFSERKRNKFFRKKEMRRNVQQPFFLEPKERSGADAPVTIDSLCGVVGWLTDGLKDKGKTIFSLNLKFESSFLLCQFAWNCNKFVDFSRRYALFDWGWDFLLNSRQLCLIIGFLFTYLLLFCLSPSANLSECFLPTT